MPTRPGGRGGGRQAGLRGEAELVRPRGRVSVPSMERKPGPAGPSGLLWLAHGGWGERTQIMKGHINHTPNVRRGEGSESSGDGFVLHRDHSGCSRTEVRLTHWGKISSMQTTVQRRRCTFLLGGEHG